MVSDCVNALLINPTKAATFLNIKNQKSEFDALLGGPIQCHLCFYPEVGAIIRIATTDSNEYILLNTDINDEICDMDIFKAYQIIHSLKLKLNVVDEVSNIEKDYVNGNLDGSIKETEEIKLDKDVKIQKVTFTFFQENEEDEQNRKDTLGNASVYVLDADDLSCEIIDAAGSYSNELLKSFSGLKVYEDKKTARAYEGVSGKIAIIQDLFVDGPYANKGDLELFSIGEIIQYFSNVHHVDFLVMNPNLVKLNLLDEIREYAATDDVLPELTGMLAMEYGFAYNSLKYPAVVLDIDLECDEEEIFGPLDVDINEMETEDEDFPEDIDKEFAMLHFVKEFVTEVIEMENLSLEAKGLLIHFAAYPHWTIDGLMDYCMEDFESIAVVIEELEGEEIIFQDGDGYCIDDEFIHYIGLKFIMNTMEKQNESDETLESPGVEGQEAFVTRKYGTDFEIMSIENELKVVPMSEAYSTVETYKNELSPFIFGNMLMRKNVSLTSSLQYENTPLMYAVFHNDNQLVHSILENLSVEEMEQEISAKNMFGQNALSIAIRNDSDKLVERLLDAGFSLDENISLDKEVKGNDLFTFALLYSSYDSFYLLLNHAKEQNKNIAEQIEAVLELEKKTTQFVPEEIIYECHEWLKHQKY